jgi:hypothetical protein
MSDAKSNTLENAYLGLLFNATSLATLFQNSSASATSVLAVALHTASPTDGPTSGQDDNECSYTSYARVGVARNSSGWTVSGSSVHPSTNITFPQATGGTETVTHFSIGTSTSTGGTLLYYGTVTPNISVSNGVTPQLTTATAITES